MVRGLLDSTLLTRSGPLTSPSLDVSFRENGALTQGYSAERGY